MLRNSNECACWNLYAGVWAGWQESEWNATGTPDALPQYMLVEGGGGGGGDMPFTAAFTDFKTVQDRWFFWLHLARHSNYS